MSYKRWLALCGLLASVMVVLAFTVVGGDTPDEKAGAREVVQYFQDHQGQGLMAALMVAISAVLFVLFAVRVLDELRGGGAESDGMPLAAFAGFVILAVGLLFLAAVHFTLVFAADHGFPQAAQAFNVFDNNDFFILAGGLSILTLTSGISILRRPSLPRGFGWSGVVIGVLCMAGPAGFIGALLAMLWIIVVSIRLTAQKDVVVAA